MSRICIIVIFLSAIVAGEDIEYFLFDFYPCNENAPERIERELLSTRVRKALLVNTKMSLKWRVKPVPGKPGLTMGQIVFEKRPKEDSIRLLRDYLQLRIAGRSNSSCLLYVEEASLAISHANSKTSTVDWLSYGFSSRIAKPARPAAISAFPDSSGDLFFEVSDGQLLHILRVEKEKVIEINSFDRRFFCDPSFRVVVSDIIQRIINSEKALTDVDFFHFCINGPLERFDQLHIDKSGLRIHLPSKVSNLKLAAGLHQDE